MACLVNVGIYCTASLLSALSYTGMAVMLIIFAALRQVCALSVSTLPLMLRYKRRHRERDLCCALLQRRSGAEVQEACAHLYTPLMI